MRRASTLGIAIGQRIDHGRFGEHGLAAIAHARVEDLIRRIKHRAHCFNVFLVPVSEDVVGDGFLR
jgi:hypothetical protein